MIEIKFRGKRIDNGKWAYGDYFKTPLSDENSGVSNGDGWFFLSDGTERHCIGQEGVSFVVDPKTIGQYTGLKDRNGVEIYHGDILKTETDKNMVVGWSPKYASFCIDRKGWAFVHYFNEGCDPEYVEVIGNKYDNSDLLL